MAYQIPSDLIARVQAQVATGHFSSEDEVLREALDSLEKRQRGLSELQAMVLEADEDVVAGRVGDFDVEKTMSVVRDRLAERPDSQ